MFAFALWDEERGRLVEQELRLAFGRWGRLVGQLTYLDARGIGRVVLVGNPNVGKSALFGALTGTYVTVSNYPGTTVAITAAPANDPVSAKFAADTPVTERSSASQPQAGTNPGATTMPNTQRPVAGSSNPSPLAMISCLASSGDLPSNLPR